MNQLPEMPIRAKYATLDSDGNNIAEALAGAGGTKLYQHKISVSGGGAPRAFIIYATSDTPVEIRRLSTDNLIVTGLISAISDSQADSITPLLVLSTRTGSAGAYRLYDFNISSGTFTEITLGSVTITDTVTAL